MENKRSLGVTLLGVAFISLGVCFLSLIILYLGQDRPRNPMVFSIYRKATQIAEDVLNNDDLKISIVMSENGKKDILLIEVKGDKNNPLYRGFKNGMKKYDIDALASGIPPAMRVLIYLFSVLSILFIICGTGIVKRVPWSRRLAFWNLTGGFFVFPVLVWYQYSIITEAGSFFRNFFATLPFSGKIEIPHTFFSVLKGIVLIPLVGGVFVILMNYITFVSLVCYYFTRYKVKEQFR